MNHIPKRKQIRLQDYDYSTHGAYFITVCIADRKPLLWDVGAAILPPVLIAPTFSGGIFAAPTSWCTANKSTHTPRWHSHHTQSPVPQS